MEMQQVTHIVFRSSLRVLLFWSMPILVLLATGCVSLHKGYVVTGARSSACKEQVVNEIAQVYLTPAVADGQLRVLAQAMTESSMREITTSITQRREKRLTIGLFPGIMSTIDEDPSYSPGGNLAITLFLPLGVVFMNALTLGLPTLDSLFYTPFCADYRYNRELKNGALVTPHGALGLMGVCKYSRDTPVLNKEAIRVIQQGIVQCIPLSGVKVKCDIPEVSFSDVGESDANGTVEFKPSIVPKRRSDVILSLIDAAKNPYAGLLREYIGKPETYRVAFNGGDAEPTVSARLHALKSATWKPEPVALAPLTAAGTSVASAQTLSEWFYNSLAETRYFTLMARSDMETILKEQKFQRSDNCDDTGCLVEMGKILSVRRMIGGSIGNVGEQAVFTARMVDVETGEILATSKTAGVRDSAAMLKMIEEGCEALCNDYAERMSRPSPVDGTHGRNLQ